MKIGKYQSLSEDTTRSTFLDYTNALQVPGINYFAIGVQDTINKTSTSLMSNTDWQQHFQTLNLAEFDPIRKAAFNSRATLFSFDEVDCQNNYGKEVMLQRKRYEIPNGIVLMRRSLTHNFMLTVATDFKKFNAYRFFIDNREALNIVFDDLVSLISPVTIPYQLKISNLNKEALKLETK